MLYLSPWSGEGNGIPLRYFCLENPMDGGAWWAAVYGVAQSRTRLKRLSSSGGSSSLVSTTSKSLRLPLLRPSLSPTRIHRLSDTEPHPSRPHRPGSRARGQAPPTPSTLGALVSGGVRAVKAQGAQRLPEAGPLVPPPSDSVGGAGPGAAGVPRPGGPSGSWRGAPWAVSPSLTLASLQRVPSQSHPRFPARVTEALELGKSSSTFKMTLIASQPEVPPRHYCLTGKCGFVLIG